MDISLNAKIYNDLKERIRNGLYAEGDLLPTENQLQTIYGVSRAPVRQALGRLENDGLIIRCAGKGTFVASKSMWASAYLSGFRTEFLKKANLVICKTLSVAEVIPSQTIAELLELRPNTKVVRIERLRSFDGRAFQYLEHYIKGISLEVFIKAGNIVDMPFFLANYGLYQKTVQEEVDATLVNERIGSKLNVPTNTAVLQIKHYTYDNYDKIYEYIEYYTLSDKWKYRVKFVQD